MNRKILNSILASAVLIQAGFSSQAANLVWSVAITNRPIPIGVFLEIGRATSDDGSSLWTFFESSGGTNPKIVWLAGDGTLIKELPLDQKSEYPIRVFPYRVTASRAVALQRTGPYEETLIELRRSGLETSTNFTQLRGTFSASSWLSEDSFSEGLFTAELTSSSVTTIHKYVYGSSMTAIKASQGVILSWDPITSQPFSLQRSGDLVRWDDLNEFKDATSGVQTDASEEKQFFRLRVK